jgi:hypothetical protein
MTRVPIRELRGLNDLAQDMIGATVDLVEETHGAFARQPFALLAQIGVIAGPVRAIERFQQAATDGVYGTIRAISQIAGAAATQALDLVERQENACLLPQWEHSAPGGGAERP